MTGSETSNPAADSTSGGWGDAAGPATLRLCSRRPPGAGRVSNGYLRMESSDYTIQDLQAFEPQAFRRLHDSCFPQLYRYALRRTDNVRLAEDAASEAFVRLVEAYRAGAGPTSQVRAWLFRTTSNIVNDHYRRLYREQEQADRAKPLNDPTEQSRDFAGDVSGVLHELTPDQQHVVQLRFFAGLTLEETGEVIGKSPQAVKSLQFRAIQALRGIMQAEPI